MKAAFVVVLVILAIVAPIAVLKERENSALKESVAQLQTDLKTERDQRKAFAERPDIAADELARLREGNAELIRLRGEVGALKRERDELVKKASGLEVSAARAKEREETARAAAQTAEAVEANRLKDRASTVLLGAQGGLLRAKILSGQPLTQEETQALANTQQRVAELEKSPADFAQYQTAYLASVLGWSNDPRSVQLQDLLTKVAQAANNRGLTFNAPGQSPENWNDAQKALDNRATGVVKGLLTPDEAAVLDKALPGVMSANPAAAPRAK
jgi:hypothetical protein